MTKINLMSIKAFIFLIGSCWIMGCNSDEIQNVTTLENLVMEDNFDGSSLDRSIWNYDIGTGNSISGDGWGNNELQYYTDRSSNVRVSDGMLAITAHRESQGSSSYTSGRINSQNLKEMTYGRIEARMKLPWGQGIWPAFWMLGSNINEVGWPQCGEIDIMEFRGQNPTKILGSVHGPGYSGGDSEGKEYDLMNDRFDSGFHTFGVEWGPEGINYYVDDVLYNQITPDDVTGEWVFDNNFFLIINLAVGGNFVGPPNNDTVFPQTMYVDWVRVYN